MSTSLQRNDKFVTVENQRSKIPPPASTQFATHVRRSELIFTLLYTDCSTQNANEQFVSSLLFYLANFAFHLLSQTKI